MTNHQSYDYRQQRGSHRIFDILEEKSHSISSCHVLRAQQERHALPVVKDNQIYIHIAIKISLQNDNDINFLPTHRFLGLGEERPCENASLMRGTHVSTIVQNGTMQF